MRKSRPSSGMPKATDSCVSIIAQRVAVSGLVTIVACGVCSTMVVFVHRNMHEYERCEREDTNAATMRMLGEGSGTSTVEHILGIKKWIVGHCTTLTDLICVSTFESAVYVPTFALDTIHSILLRYSLNTQQTSHTLFT
jgi:hypothetical protein